MRINSKLNARFVFVLILGTLCVYFVRGFFFSDPYFFDSKWNPIAYQILQITRIALPIAVIAALVLVWRIDCILRNLIRATTLTTSLLITFLFTYPVLNLYSRHRYRPNLARYHSFLQIAPPTTHSLPKHEPTTLLQYPSSYRPLRILTLGGSTTAWKGSTGLGWTDMLSEQLTANLYGRPVELINGATEWYTTAHSLIHYQFNLDDVEADIIIIMHAINDLLTNADFSYYSSGSFRADYGHFHGPLQRILYRRDEPLQVVNDFLQAAWYHHPRTIIETEQFPGKKAYRRNMERLIAHAVRRGSLIVLLTQPFLYHSSLSEEEFHQLYMVRREAIGPHKQWSLQTALSGMEQYNEEVRKIALEGTAHIFDLEKT
ncbi:MAG: SGNH/GDSL hydrolase family protein, partial [Bdellovibrionota bacterium]